MRVVYCDQCKDISIKSRFEKDTCSSCGRAARLVPYSRPWQYYASSVLLFATAVGLLLAPIPDLLVRAGIFAAALAVALVLSSWSIRSMRARILKRVREAAELEARM